MTPDDRRRAWLEAAIDEQSERKFAENIAAYTQTCPRQYATKEEEHAFECGWDWAVEMIRTEVLPRLDTPLRELEEALEKVHRELLNHGKPLSCHVCAALARLPWREENTQ